MGNLYLKPYEAVLVASALRTASGNSGAIDLPMLSDMRFLLDITAVSGTTATLDIALEITTDDGTTWFPIARYAQWVQASGAGKSQIQLSSWMHAGQAAGSAALAYTGGALASSGALSKKIRFYWTFGGTTPNWTFSISVVGNHRNALP